MKHYDYDWDLESDRIILDKELNIGLDQDISKVFQEKITGTRGLLRDRC